MNASPAKAMSAEPSRSCVVSMALVVGVTVPLDMLFELLPSITSPRAYSHEVIRSRRSFRCRVSDLPMNASCGADYGRADGPDRGCPCGRGDPDPAGTGQ